MVIYSCVIHEINAQNGCDLIKAAHHLGWPLSARQTIYLPVMESDIKHRCEEGWKIGARGHRDLHRWHVSYPKLAGILKEKYFVAKSKPKHICRGVVAEVFQCRQRWKIDEI